MDEQIRQMKRYLRPRVFSRDLIFLIIAGIAIYIVFRFYVPTIKTYLETGDFDIVSTWEISVTLLFLVFLCTLEGIYKSIKFGNQLRKWKKAVELDDIARDFAHATPMYNNRVMMGTEYAFGKNCCAAIPYADIDRIYEYVHSTNSIKDERNIRVKMIDGKVLDLCYLKVYRKAPDEEEAIIRAILERNPAVKLGVE